MSEQLLDLVDALSAVPQFSLNEGFENSLVGVVFDRSAGASPGKTASRDQATLLSTEVGLMVVFGELMMILKLQRQGLSITAIARRTGRDPKRCGNKSRAA